jgi:hypothetical protein
MQAGRCVALAKEQPSADHGHGQAGDHQDQRESDPRRGRLVTFGGEIAGTAAGACPAA